MSKSSSKAKVKKHPANSSTVRIYGEEYQKGGIEILPDKKKGN